MLYNKQPPNSVLRSITCPLSGSALWLGLGQFLVYFILEPEFKRASQALDTHITFPHPHPPPLTSYQPNKSDAQTQYYGMGMSAMPTS